MKVLITGATGFVGGRLLKRFGERKRQDSELHIVATARHLEPGADVWSNADRYVPADLSRGCPAIESDVCIHAAGLADDRSTPAALTLANVTATHNLLEAVQDCRLFIFISSASVYGTKPGAWDEDDATPDAIRSDYGRSKWAAEHVVRTVCERRHIEYVILRPRAIYGVGDRVLLPRLLRLMRPPVLLMVGDGRISMSLTSIEHLVAVVEDLALRRAGRGTFNVADLAVYQLRQVLAALYTARHQRPPRVIEIPVALISRYLAVTETLGVRAALSRQSLEYLTQDCVLNCTRARDVLGYAPATTFFDHVSSMAAACDAGA